ncbi:MAG: hypothetical protein HXS53_07750 [Theionarchaea archaeon]|nr:hypothetical protein [Theionarchaea archaeon]
MDPIDFESIMMDFIQSGSIQPGKNENVGEIPTDKIRINITDSDTLYRLFEREDLFSQLRHISNTLNKAGKTMEISYRNARVCTVGKHGHSLFLQVLGLDHVSLGNPLRVYQILRIKRK